MSHQQFTSKIGVVVSVDYNNGFCEIIIENPSEAIFRNIFRKREQLESIRKLSIEELLTHKEKEVRDVGLLFSELEEICTK